MCSHPDSREHSALLQAGEGGNPCAPHGAAGRPQEQPGAGAGQAAATARGAAPKVGLPALRAASSPACPVASQRDPPASCIGQGCSARVSLPAYSKDSSLACPFMAGADYNIVAIVHSVSPRYAVEASAAQCCPVCRAAAVPGPLGGMDAFTRNGLSTSLAQLDTIFSEVSCCSLVSESGARKGSCQAQARLSLSVLWETSGWPCRHVSVIVCLPATEARTESSI